MTKAGFAILASVLFAGAGCTRDPSAPARPSAATSPAIAQTITTTQEFMQSPFVEEWISRLDSPFFQLNPTQLAQLCAHRVTVLDIGAPAGCAKVIDPARLGAFFDFECRKDETISLRLKSKVSCSAAALETLRQREKSGPWITSENSLRANTEFYPVLGQAKPLVPVNSSDEIAQISLPTTESWIKSMGAQGAVRVLLRAPKLNDSQLAALAKFLIAFESPTKFSPQIKMPLNLEANSGVVNQSLQINWIAPPPSQRDAASEGICNLVSGWIDYQILKMPTTETKMNVDVACALEIESPFDAPDPQRHLEVGRLPLPIISAKTGTYLLKTLSEALSPSALLGLRLDL